MEVAERASVHMLRALFHHLNDSEDTSCQITASVKQANPHQRWQQNDFTSKKKKKKKWETWEINLGLLTGLPFHWASTGSCVFLCTLPKSHLQPGERKVQVVPCPSYSAGWNGSPAEKLLEELGNARRMVGRGLSTMFSPNFSVGPPVPSSHGGHRALRAPGLVVVIWEVTLCHTPPRCQGCYGSGATKIGDRV